MRRKTGNKLENEYDKPVDEQQDFDLTEQDLERQGLMDFELNVSEVEHENENIRGTLDGEKKEGTARRRYLLNNMIAVLLFLLLGSAGFLWVLFDIHPGTSLAVLGKETSHLHWETNLQANLENLRTRAVNLFLEEEHQLQKIYAIAPGATQTLVPNPECFGVIPYDQPEEVLTVLEKAQDYGLIDMDTVVFDPNVSFYYRGGIQYYLDETILVLCWKEYWQGKLINLMEIKVADGSQFRRKIVGDDYYCDYQMFATQLAEQTNAVAACSADYFAFRPLGIMCYDGTLYRYNNTRMGSTRIYNCVDTLFIDEQGDFIFYDRGTEMEKEQLQQYIDQNHIQFSLSFGPILVRDGVAQYNEDYPIGQINEPYSRAGIGQIDERHYLFVIISNSGRENPRATTNEFADYMVVKGVKQGYNLDGGQTGEYILQNKVASIIDFGNERLVSDIIYFGSALPMEDWE